MEKNTIVLCALIVVFLACKHESVLPDTEYFNQEAIDKITTYSRGYSPTGVGSFSISSNKDSSGNNQFFVGYHIDYNHTMDAIQVDKSTWTKLPEHFGNHFVTTSLSSNNNKTVAFKIRSKSPQQDEIINGEVTVPKQTPITASDLGNNTFKITWIAQNRQERILISLSSFYVYDTPYYRGFFAAETEDDGEYILKPTAFEKFERDSSNNNIIHTVKQKMSIHLNRQIANTRVTITQPSTGKIYDVYGGFSDETRIDAIKIR
jgi:hypothetical protein